MSSAHIFILDLGEKKVCFQPPVLMHIFDICIIKPVQMAEIVIVIQASTPHYLCRLNAFLTLFSIVLGLTDTFNYVSW